MYSQRQADINRRLDAIGRKVANRLVSFQELLDIFVEEFDNYPVPLEFSHNPKMTPKQKENDAYWNNQLGTPFGYYLYYEYNDTGYNKIGLEFQSSSFHFSTTPWQWDNLKFRLSMGLQHELVHRDQSIATKFMVPEDLPIIRYGSNGTVLKSSWREYLSESGELEARGHDLAIELTKIHKKNITNKLKDLFDIAPDSTFTSVVYNMYVKDVNVKKKLVNYTNEFLDNGVRWAA